MVRIQKRPRRSKPILSLTNFRYVWTLKSWSAPWRRDRKLMKYLYPRQRGSNRFLIDEPNLEIFIICIFSSFVLSFINWHKPLIISKYSLMLSYLSLNSWNSHITVRLGTFAFDQPPETARSHRIYFLPNVSKYAYIISLNIWWLLRSLHLHQIWCDQTCQRCKVIDIPLDEEKWNFFNP